MMWGNHWMFGGYIWIFWLAVIVGIFFLIRWLVRSGGPGAQPPPRESAMDVLKKRYASGEISREEFEQKKKDLLS
jgi:putative membrane protein